MSTEVLQITSKRTKPCYKKEMILDVMNVVLQFLKTETELVEYYEAYMILFCHSVVLFFFKKQIKANVLC